MFALIAAVTASLVIGFLAGLLTFKRSMQWCPGCGATLRCPECRGAQIAYPALAAEAAKR